MGRLSALYKVFTSVKPARVPMCSQTMHYQSWHFSEREINGKTSLIVVMGTALNRNSGRNAPKSPHKNYLDDILYDKNHSGRTWLQKHIVYVMIVVSVFLWAVSQRIYRHLYETQATPHAAFVSIKTKCSESARGGLGPDQTGDCTQHIYRLVDYCHEDVGKVSGDEAHVKDDKYELVHIAMTVRHGDRSAIHTIPGSLGSQEAEAADARPLEPWQHLSDGLNHPVHGNDFLDIRALEHLAALSKFNLVPLGDTSEVPAPIVEDHQEDSKALEHQELPPVRPLPPALQEGHVFTVPDFDLAPGQLTTRGFMQEYHLGSYLRERYGGYLEGAVAHPANLYVRSTNYPRTIQSVAGLLLGLVPDIGGKNTPIDILSHVSETSEVMHGIGLRLSSQGVSASNPGDKEILGGCDNSVSLAKKQKLSYALSPGVKAKVYQTFGEAASERFVTDLADASLPPLCHNRPLPCSIDESKGCMDEHDLGEVMQEADRAFCARYTGPNGGGTATKLSIYPFMEEILFNLKDALRLHYLWKEHDKALEERIKEATKNGGKYEKTYDDNIITIMEPDPVNIGQTRERQDSRVDRKRLAVFMGHDTVIAPVLAGLGVYTGGLCAWPPYASRIVFELFAAVNGGEKDERGFVRVIYNGEDLTKRIKTCEGEAPCPLEALESAVASLYSPHNSLKEACQE